MTVEKIRDRITLMLETNKGVKEMDELFEKDIESIVIENDNLIVTPRK